MTHDHRLILEEIAEAKERLAGKWPPADPMRANLHAEAAAIRAAVAFYDMAMGKLEGCPDANP